MHKKNSRQRCLSSNLPNSNRWFLLTIQDLFFLLRCSSSGILGITQCRISLFKTALQVGETCQFDQNKCREAQPIEVLTITAPETFNFQAVVVVWNTEPVSVWLSTFMLQRFATTLDRWLLNDFWLDSMVLGCFSAYGLEWCPCIPPNKSGYRSPVTRSMFSIKQSEGIFIIWWPFLALRLGSPAGFAVN